MKKPSGLKSHKPELLSLSCPNEKPVRKIINNSGLLRLESGCTAMTTSTTLTGITIHKTSEEYIYNPEISLNLTNISPTMDKFSNFSPITREKLRHQHNQPWEKLHNGQPLREIEE